MRASRLAAGTRRGLSTVALTTLAALLALFLAATTPALAQSTVTEQLIQDLNSKLLALAIPVTLIVEGILLYTVWRFRQSEEPQPTRENRQLEITWTVATAVILLFVGFATYGVMANENVITTQQDVAQLDDDAVVVEAEGHQWFWRFDFPGENVSQVQDEILLPVNRTLVIRTSSADVIHSFSVPGLGLKVDAIPGRTNVLKTRALETGNYTLFCTEYCGAGHSRMVGNVTIVSEERYRAWLDDQRGGGG